MAAHSSLSWRYRFDSGYIVRDDGPRSDVVASHVLPDDGAFIVRAVNSHAALVLALKCVDNMTQFATAQHYEIPASEWRDVMAHVRKALQQAEAQ